MIIPSTAAKNQFYEVLRSTADEDVIVVRYGRPVARIVSTARFDALIEELEDALDRLSIYESSTGAEDMRIPLGKAKIELGLT